MTILFTGGDKPLGGWPEVVLDDAVVLLQCPNCLDFWYGRFYELCPHGCGCMGFDCDSGE